MHRADANRELNRAEIREGRTKLRSKPVQLNLELTGICDVNPPCVFCTGKNVGHNYSPLDVSYFDKYRGFLDAASRVNEDSFGEPLTHRRFVDVASRFTRPGQTFSFVTNGLQLDEKRADALSECGPSLGFHVSFNAATPETFRKLTGRDFAVVLANVSRYARLYRLKHRQPPDLTLTFIVMRMNRHEVPAFLDIAADVGAKALLASLHERPSIPLGNFGHEFVYEDERLSVEEYAEIAAEARRLAAERRVQLLVQWDAAVDSTVRSFAEPDVDVPCLVPWKFLFVQEHSRNVYGCPYHRRPMGNVDRAPLEAVWNGPVATGMRESLVRGEIPKFCCENGAGCPLLFEVRRSGFPQPLEPEIVVGRNDYWHLGAGWNELERIPDAIRWTRSVAEFRIRGSDRATLAMECTSFKPDLGAAPIVGRLEVGAGATGFRIGSTSWTTVKCPIPAEAARPGPSGGRELAGRIVVENPWKPSEVLESSFMEAVVGRGRRVDGSRDPRELGIAVRRIWTE